MKETTLTGVTLPTLRERWKKLSQEFDLRIMNYEQQVIEYDKFIQFTGRTLQLGDFIPMDSKGEPMEKPERVNAWSLDISTSKRNKGVSKWIDKCIE